MSGCMPGWLARRLVVGLCVEGRHAAGRRPCGRAVAGQLMSRGMATKRDGDALSPAGHVRHRKRQCAPTTNTEYIPLSNTPPRTPTPAGGPDFGDFIFIDTTPTPVDDAPAPPRLRRGGAGQKSQDVEVVDVVDTPDKPERLQTSDSDIDVVYMGPGRGGARSSGPRVSQRRMCHTRARRGINTQAPAAPALAPTEDEEDGREEVEVVERQEVEVVVEGQQAPPPPHTNTEVEVIDVDSVEEVEVRQQQEQEDGVEEVGGVLDSNSNDSSGSSGGGVDVSGGGFVSLGPVSVSQLTNTTIDLSDEVLRRRRHLEALRPWDRTSLGHVVAKRGMRRGCVPLTVLSYNVLAQTLLRDNPQLYRGCGADHLTWDYRWALLQHEVESLRPDVLLLQEVEAGHYHSHYLPWFTSQGYQGLYKKRTGTKADGCAIFYLGEVWRLAEYTSVEYYQPAAPAVLDRDNVGLIAKLVPKQGGGGAGVCVATTHLLYNPRRHDVKLAQAALLMAELDRMCYTRQVAGQPQYCPVVVAGDLNAEPHSALLHFLQDGRLQYEGLSRRTLARHGTQGPELGPELLPPELGITGACQHSALAQGRWLEGQHGPIISPADKRLLEEALIHLHHSDRSTTRSAPAAAAIQDPLRGPGWLTHGFMLQSVYRQRRRGSGGPEVTTFQDRWCCVDYMMYSRTRHHSGSMMEGPLKLLARLTLPTAQEANLFSPMPSDVCPSDHFPLAAQFMLQS